MERSDRFAVAIVDRIESEYAVLDFIEPRHTMEVPLEMLPPDAREGMALKLNWEPRPEIERRWNEELSEQQEELL